MVQSKLECLYTGVVVSIAFFIPLSTFVTDGLFLSGALCFFFTPNWRAKLKNVWCVRPLLGMGLFFLWMVIAIIYTVAPFQDITRDLLKYDYLVLGILLAPAFLQDKCNLYALHAFLLSIAITILCSVCKYFSGLPIHPNFGPLLVFKDHIQTSFLVAFAAYFAMILWAHDKDSHSFSRHAYALFAVICTCFLFSTGGRSGYVVFLALMGYFLWDLWRIKGLFFAMLGGLLLLFIAHTVSPVFHTRVAEAIADIQAHEKGEDDTSVGLRLSFVAHSLPLIKAHPVFGSGTGSFTKRYAKLALPADFQTRNPHNQYIYVAVQWGAVGLLFLLGLFTVQWLGSRPLPYLHASIAKGVLIGIMVGSFANSWLLDTTEGHFYAYFMVLAFMQHGLCKQSKSPRLVSSVT